MAGQHQENSQDQIFPHDIAEQTQRQGEDPGQVADDFNGQHQRGQPPDGTQEVFNIFWAVKFDAHNMGSDENDQGAGQRGIDVGRRREESRYQAQHVGA